MNWEDIKKFIRFHIANSKFGVVLGNAKDIHEPITNAVKELSNTIKENKNEIRADINLEPVVTAQKETTQAIKSIPSVPETDFSSLEEKLDSILKAISKKEDNKPIVKAIESLKKSFPKMEKQEVIDYTLMLDDMMKIMESPKNKKEFESLQEQIKKLGTSADLEVIAEWLKVISEKEYPEFPEFKFTKEGRLQVEVDKTGGGGGGGGLTSIEDGYLENISSNSNNQATSAKQDDIISEINKTVRMGVPEHDFRSYTYVAAGNGLGKLETITYKVGGSGGTTVAVITITYNASNNQSTVTKTIV